MIFSYLILIIYISDYIVKYTFIKIWQQIYNTNPVIFGYVKLMFSKTLINILSFILYVNY